MRQKNLKRVFCFFLAGILLYAINTGAAFDRPSRLLKTTTIQTLSDSSALIPSNVEDAFENEIRNSLERNVRLRKRIENYNMFHPDTGGSSEPAGTWYQKNVEPSYTCTGEERLGKQGDGGKWVCNPGILAKKHTCLIYSIGSNNKFDFETALLNEVSRDCEIHVFDHTVSTLRLISKRRKPWRVHFHQYGLAAKTSSSRNIAQGTPSLKSLSDIVKDLGHEHRTLDILKIDCEGCEWTTFESWFEAPVKISQILVEVHQGTTVKKGDHENDALWPPAKRLFTKLHREGFHVFHKEPNVQWTAFGNLCLEFSLVRLPL